MGLQRKYGKDAAEQKLSCMAGIRWEAYRYPRVVSKLPGNSGHVARVPVSKASPTCRSDYLHISTCSSNYPFRQLEQAPRPTNLWDLLALQAFSRPHYPHPHGGKPNFPLVSRPVLFHIEILLSRLLWCLSRFFRGIIINAFYGLDIQRMAMLKSMERLK